MKSRKIKKVLLSLAALTLLGVITSCNPPIDDPIIPPVVDPEPEVPQIEDGIYFHYQRKDDMYAKFALWIWGVGAEGKEYTFNGKDDYGAIAAYTFEELNLNDETDGTVGFIIKSAGEGNWDKDPVNAADRFIDFSLFEKDSKNNYHIYLKTEDMGIYTSPDKVLETINRFVLFYDNFSKKAKIYFTTNFKVDKYTMYVGDEVLFSESGLDVKTIEKTIEDETLIDITKQIRLEVFAKNSKTPISANVDMANYFKSPVFTEKYKFDGELGAIYNKDKTIFRVWSPMSTEIDLLVYNNGTPTTLDSTIGDDTHTKHSMVKLENGLFEITVDGDLDGKYYTYQVTNGYFTKKECVDPYAKSTGINGLRGMVVNFEKTNPDNWDNITLHDTKRNKLTVYETHIADITSSKTWTGNKANSKLFNGAYEEGTTFSSNNVTVKTGFDHIKELGVNAVQLVPIYDQANDETPGNVKFNWGYNPANYNALEGSYSSDPYDGYARIKEFKNLVAAYNQSGMNIIMDVVYNHVADLNANSLNIIMPSYYFRYSGGKPMNGSGCGNETASENYMFKKFMIDSTTFWAKEYKLGGFRFDLMGLHDTIVMEELSAELHKMNENIVVYGEPWAAGTIGLQSPFIPANQSNISKFNGYGAFNDITRDALIKGGLSGVGERGWVNSEFSASSDKDRIISGIMGRTGSLTKDPNKVLNYVTCHDNYTLHDRMQAAGITNEDDIKKMAMLANSIIFTGSGATFMLAGEEFLRTKDGDENSYQSSYEINELDYQLKIENSDMFENYQKLLQFKQNYSALSLENSDTIDSTFSFDETDSNSIIYRFESDGKEFVIAHGSVDSKIELPTLDLDGYTLYLDTLNELTDLKDGLRLKNFQTIIAYK